MRHWRLSGFYLFYFAALGALVPYWSLYLHYIGFSAGQIGLLMALPMISRVVAPNVWSWIADERGAPVAVVRVASVSALACYSGVFFGTSFAWMVGVMIAFTFFWHASLPQLEAATLTTVGRDYGKIRLWGSIGFIATVLGLGPVLDQFGIRWLLPALFALFAGIALFSFWIQQPAIPEPAALHTPFVRAAWRRPVVAFLVACFLMQASHGPYYTFYSIDLARHGYSKAQTGALWAFAVVCEIGVFVWARHLLERIPLHTLFLWSFAAACVRWLLIGLLADHVWVLIAAQVLHAATFGLYHVTAVHIAYQFFRGPHRNRGQALYGSAAGAGGAVGSLFSGFLWERLGATMTFVTAAALDVIAFVLVFVVLSRVISSSTAGGNAQTG